MVRETREKWAGLVARWAQSGLTAKRFAAKTGINAGTLQYYKWKWRLGHDGRAASTKNSRLKAEVGFVELRARDLAPAEGSSGDDRAFSRFLGRAERGRCLVMKAGLSSTLTKLAPRSARSSTRGRRRLFPICHLVPGTKTLLAPNCGLPELRLAFDNRAGLERTQGKVFSYRPCEIRPVSTVVGEEIISYYADLNAAAIPGDKADPRERLLQLLSSATTPSKPPPGPSAAPYSFGELVQVQFPAAPTPIPCVIVSNEQIAKARLPTAMVLQTIPATPEELRGGDWSVIPLPARESGLTTDRLIDLTTLLGVQHLHRWVTPFSRRLYVTAGIVDQITQGLKDFYAS